MNQFIENYLNQMWGRGGGGRGEGTTAIEEEIDEIISSSPVEENKYSTDILITPCR
jgi:hypothetical protein